MEAKTMKVTNRKQFECLVAAMEKNPAVAKGQKFAEAANFSKPKYAEVWNRLSTDLNSIGPPIRSVLEWQKVWTDYKLKIKKKLAHNRNESRATGGGKNKIITFSSCEESVIALLSLNTAINSTVNIYGLESTTACTATGTNQLDIQSSVLTNENDHPVANEFATNDDQDDQDIVENNSSLPQPSYRSEKERREKHLEDQTTYLKEIKNSVKEIARYSKKAFYVQEKQLKLKREY